MNSEVFEKWLHDELVPRLEEPSIVIFNNASYHSRLFDKLPAFYTEEDDMKGMLKLKIIDLHEFATKDEIYQLREPLAGSKSFVDQIIAKAGREFLRLLLSFLIECNSMWLYDKRILKRKCSRSVEISFEKCFQ